MKKEIIARLHKNFEDYVHRHDDVEFWYARELQGLLGYDRWENFEAVIERARLACLKSKQSPLDHFRDATKMVVLGSGSKRAVQDMMLTRYACYLIAQNGDPRKDEIAFAMSYFAVQTRKQEVIEERLGQWERLQARERLSLSEKALSGIIFEKGVDGQGFARIRSQGDAALFGGHNTQQMKKRLGVPGKRPLADFLPTITIKAKEFANEITHFNLKKNEAIHGELAITKEHVKNNQDVRSVLAKSGIKPEKLPPAEDAKKLERKMKSLPKNFEHGL